MQNLIPVFYFLFFFSVYCGKKNATPQQDVKQENMNSSFYATAKGGLKLREKPDAAGQVLGLIAEGEKVDVIETTGVDVTITGKTGKWSKINWQGKTGWVFGGFLSAGAPAIEAPKMPDSFLGTYLFAGELEPGNMPSRVQIEKTIIAKAIGGYANSGSYCKIAGLDIKGETISITCAEMKLTPEEYGKYQIEENASSLKIMVIADKKEGRLLIDRELYKKRKPGEI